MRKSTKQAAIIFLIFFVTAISTVTIIHYNKDNLEKTITASNNSSQVVDNQFSNPNFNSADKYFHAVSYNTSEYLSDDEFVIAGGVRLGMSYEEVAEILGDNFEVIDNSPGVKSILKDGYHFGFYQVDETFSNQTDLPIDGVFRLLSVSLYEYPYDEFPRGIKIGDPIEDVLNKFPGQDKTLRKWAYQNIYGKDESGKPRAVLMFTMYNECYMFRAMTAKQILIVNFDRNNRVSSLEIHKEDS